MSKGHRIYLSLGKLSLFILTVLSICIYTRIFSSPLVSLISVFLPYFYLLEIIYLLLGVFSSVTRRLTYQLLVFAIGGGLFLWPPSWIYHTPRSFSSSSSVSLTSWNVARMGELSARQSIQQARTQSLQCIVSTLKQNETDFCHYDSSNDFLNL